MEYCLWGLGMLTAICLILGGIIVNTSPKRYKVTYDWWERKGHFKVYDSHIGKYIKYFNCHEDAELHCKYLNMEDKRNFWGG